MSGLKLHLNRLQFFGSCLLRSLSRSRFACPSCGTPGAPAVDSKYMVAQLRRCPHCALQFRTPTDSVQDNRRFYQEAYLHPFMSDAPDPKQLERMKAGDFAEHPHYGYYLKILQELGCRPGDRVFEYGCSWGYGSWQIARAGYRVKAYDVAERSASYAREHLGVDAEWQLDRIEGPFDIFFSSHVMEHLPSTSTLSELAFRMLRPGGLFVAFVPNGSDCYRRRALALWRNWGQTHPLLLDENHFDWLFAAAPRLIASGSWNLGSWDLNAIHSAPFSEDARTVLDLSGDELLIAVRKTESLKSWRARTKQSAATRAN